MKNKRSSRNTTTEKDHNLWCAVVFLMNHANDYMKIHDHNESFSFVCHPTCRALANVIKELKLVDGIYIGVAEYNNSHE